MKNISPDLYRYIGDAKNSKIKFWRTLFFVPGYRFIFFLRKANRFKSTILIGLFFRIIVKRMENKFGFQISYKTKIGHGFYIGHWGTIVITHNAIIGKNCNINHLVTIGEASRGKLKGSPIIGDYVWIGAQSIIVGKINIGNNVLIAPGTFVNFDVPSNSIVIGNPGKIIPKEDATYGYINRVQKHF